MSTKSMSSTSDDEVDISRDSLDSVSLCDGNSADHPKPAVMVSALSLGSTLSFSETTSIYNPANSKDRLGKNMLDEMADKEKFFKELNMSPDSILQQVSLILFYSGKLFPWFVLS